MTIIPQIALTENTPTVWYGCYDGGWQNIISDLSFRHPAKFSRSLVNRIYSYALERGYLKPGDCVLDPFGGVGLGALDALSNGLSWVGVELEKSFHDLGQGCDCTGISKADWIRYYGRWDKMAHKDGRHWCPQCLAQAKQVTDSRQLSFFEPEPTAAYTRNSGIIPSTQPHYYRGNLDLFRKYAKPGTWAVLLNGDSRNLRAVIGQAQVDGLLSSPPYVNAIEQRNETTTEGDRRHVERRGRNPDAGGGLPMREYGRTTGQLGAMKPGRLADSLLASPPYIQALGHDSGHPRLDEVEDKRRATEGSSRRNGYGNTGGQLSAMPAGSPPIHHSSFIIHPSALVSSPSWAGNTGGRGEASRNGIDAALFDRHSGGMKKGTGDNPGNLDHLPMTGFDAALSSPPFENQNACNDPKYYANRTTNGGPLYGDYGSAAGQLGIEQGTTFWAAAREIVDESFLALKPGAYTFWVTKRFVRDGCVVNFTDQWKQLCEACGFEFVEHIQAMLIQSESEQGDLNGDVIKTKKKKSSFFRRLHEKKYPHLAIDNEDVIVMRKPR